MPCHQEKSKPESDLHKPSEIRFPCTTYEAMKKKKIEVEERQMCLRNADKVEKVMNLICWGPN
ncbi:hypothetical protein ACE6H2_011873 [Prunus campanulata]